MKTQLKIGAYLRVSTDKQVQVYEGSLDTQKYRMQEFVKSKNKDVGEWGNIVDFYIDEGVSGGTVKRPQYQRMMNDVRSGKINLILVADVSRLSRNVHDFSALLVELEQNNASFLSMKEQFDTTTPAGRLMINMVVNMAQFEREQTSERVSINFNSRALRGFVNGGRTPFGYDRDENKKGSFIVNATEAEQVRTMFRTLKDVGSVGKLIPIIEAMGIYPKYSISGKWSHDQLKSLLTSVVYIGKREVNKINKDNHSTSLKPWDKYQIVKASWPAIVDEDLFYSIQDVIEVNHMLESRRLSGSEHRIFLLSGILKCDICGRSLNGQSAHGKKNTHRYYSHGYKRNSVHQCNIGRIHADKIEQAVINYLTSIMTQAEYFSDLEEKVKRHYIRSPEQIDAEVKKLRFAYREREKEVEKLIRFQMNQDQGTETYKETGLMIEKVGNEKKLLMTRISELEDERYNQVDASIVCEGIKDNIDAFQRGYKKSPPATKRWLIHKVFRKMEFTLKGIKLYFSIPALESKQSSSKNEKSNGRINEFGAGNSLKSKIEGFEDSLSDAFENLLERGFGWGRRT